MKSYYFSKLAQHQIFFKIRIHLKNGLKNVSQNILFFYVTCSRKCQMISGKQKQHILQ